MAMDSSNISLFLSLRLSLCGEHMTMEDTCVHGRLREGASGPQGPGDPDSRQTQVPILSPVLGDVLYGTHCASWR